MKSIRDYIQGNPSLEQMMAEFDDEKDKELLDMPQSSGCGVECVKVLKKGAELIAMLPDVQILRPKMVNDVRAAVADQIKVFYYG